MNLWHDVPLGDKAPHEFNVIIEIPKGSNNKYEIDKETGLIALDRANYGTSAYPFDYGFVPQTLYDDGDALDVIVLTTYPLSTGVMVRVRPVALMKMIDGGDPDDKVIGVPVDDKRWEDIQALDDINTHSLREFKDFFENYKNLKSPEQSGNGDVTVSGYEDTEVALKAIEHSMALYQEKVTR